MLENIFSHSLTQFYKGTDPLLLALSGGPDSMALFHLLYEKKVRFHVAHIDHGWREESQKEAELLKILCEAKNIPFHLKILKKEEGNNLEEKGREARYFFFREIYKKHPFQAVCLAHHADDQAETVLKRIFEGSSLFHLGGMEEISEREGMQLWRPLIKASKREILEFLERKKIDYFLDSTNSDLHFLRGRLREKIFPELNASFGKNITKPLLRIAKQAKDLKLFIEKKANCFALERTDSGIVWDLRSLASLDEFEGRGVMKILLEKEGVYPTASTLGQIFFHLTNKNSKKKIRVGKKMVLCDRGYLSLS